MDIEARDDHGGKVRTLVMNRPAKKNALTVAMYAPLADELARAAGSSAIRAVVLTGSGDVFTAGTELRRFHPGPPERSLTHIVPFLWAPAPFPKASPPPITRRPVRRVHTENFD